MFFSPSYPQELKDLAYLKDLVAASVFNISYWIYLFDYIFYGEGSLGYAIHAVFI